MTNKRKKMRANKSKKIEILSKEKDWGKGNWCVYCYK